MVARQRDRRYVRYIGPADRLHGEFRGQPVELLGDEAGMPQATRVRFPDGSVSLVHWSHLTDAIFVKEES